MPTDGGAWGYRGDRQALVAIVATGLAVRLWVLFSGVGALDSDGAIVGLIGLRSGAGEFPAFYWGQSYGGSLEPALAALVFRLAGASALTLRLVPLALSLVAVVLTYRIGVVTVGRRGALVGAALASAGPGAFLWWSVHPGPYWAALCVALGAVLLLLEGDGPLPPRRAAAIGAMAGLAWWGNPLSAALVVPVALTRLRRLASRPAVLSLGLGAMAGAGPWLAAGLTRNWATLTAPATEIEDSSYFDHLEGFFRITQPMALGLRIPYTDYWLPTRGIAVAVYLGLLGLFLAALALVIRRRGRSPVTPLLAVATVYPFLYALPAASWYVVEPRYLLFLSPFVALLLGRAAAGPTAWGPTGRTIATFCLLVAWTTSSLIVIDENRFSPPNAADVPVPADLGALRRGLEAEGVRYAFGHYWLAYRLTFETAERVIVAPTILSRYRRYDELVRSQPAPPPYLFVRRSAILSEFLAVLEDRGIARSVRRYGDFAIVFPAEPIWPEDVVGVFDG